MKKIFTIAAALMLTATIWAQSPEKMSYQAVVRDASNALVTSQTVGMQIWILQGSVSGTAVYVETQAPNTNINGLVSLEIGNGTIVSGSFSTIDWSNGPYFIKTETDPTGGTTYTITGTSQLMSVPYALHAKTAENITGTLTETDPVFGASIANGITSTDTSNWNNHTVDTQLDETAVDAFVGNNGYLTSEIDGSTTNEIQTISRTGTTVTLSNGGGTFADSVNTYTAGTGINITGNVISSTSGGTHYLGEEFDGGIIYHMYIGSDGLQHGFIVAKTESTAKWQTSATTTNATRSWDGEYNTVLMTNSPAATYVTGLGAGWYVPSIDELSLLWHNRYYANKGLNAGGYTLLPNLGYYWSSTEYSTTDALNFRFQEGYVFQFNKAGIWPVRAIRAF